MSLLKVVKFHGAQSVEGAVFEILVQSDGSPFTPDCQRRDEKGFQVRQVQGPVRFGELCGSSLGGIEQTLLEIGVFAEAPFEIWG